MDPKHEPSQGPSPDDAKRHPHGDKPHHDPHAGHDVPPTGTHGDHHADPMAEPPEVIDSLVEFGEADDAIVGTPPAAPSSGISVIEWASLVEDDPHGTPGSHPKIDAPSDADWLKETFDPRGPLADEPQVLESADEAGVDLFDAAPAPTGHAPSTAFPGGAHAEDDEPTLIPGSASDIDLDEPDVLADDMEIVRGAFTVDSADSKDKMKAPIPELVDAAPPQELDFADAGDVQLGGRPPADDEPLDLSALSSTSGVSGVALVDDFSPGGVSDSAVSGVHLVDDALISDDLASAMLSGGEGAASPEDSHSRRDLIAEQVESGVDLRSPVLDIVDEELEAEAGQAAPVEGDPLQAGTVESAVIDAQLVEDIIHEEGGDTVGLGESPRRHGTGSSVNLSGPPPKKKRAGAKGDVDTGDIELGAASGHLLDSGLEFSNDSGINAPKSAAKAVKPELSDEVDFGSDDDISLPEKSADEAARGDSEVLSGVETTPAKAEKSGKKQRQRSGVGGWLGGGLLGAVVATGACAALWYFGVLPGGETKPKSNPVVQPIARPATFESILAHVRNGDFDKAEEAGIEKVDEANLEQLEARGEHRWLSYLKKQRTVGAEIKADDEPVKLALEDLDKVAKNEAAKNDVVADALLWIGNIHEATKNVAEARKTYTLATGRFAAEPTLKRRFDAARIRLDLQTPGKPAGVGQLPADEGDRRVLLALLLPLLQDVQPPVKPDALEAGYDFWEAVELARKQNFTEATKKLQSARDLHDKRRFAQLRKSQNPTSDPTEEIFLRTCDELKIYWTMQERLRNGKYLDLAAHADPDKALVDLIASVATGGKALEAQSAKLVEAKVITDPKDFDKGIDQLLADRKTAEAEAARVAKLGEALVKAKVIDKPEDVDQGVARLLTDRTKAAKDIADLSAAVETAKADAKQQKVIVASVETKLKATDEMKKSIKQELVGAKYLEPNAGDDKLVQGVKDVVKVATTEASKVEFQKLMAERDQARGQVAAATARTKEELAQRWQPQEMLSVWLPLLEDRTQKDLAAKAALDADRVNKDAMATPAQKARAETIKGLVLRNQEKYAEAKTALEKAKASLGKDDKAWLGATDAALLEVANPAVVYLDNADALQRQGKYDQATAALTRAMELLPKEKGTLQAKRSLVQLEAARAKVPGKLTGNEPLVAAAQQDAKAAADAGTALGYYASGRIAEEEGQYEAAVQSYRKAVAAHPELAGNGSLFRIALARVLLLNRPDRPAPKDLPKVGLLDGGAADLTPEVLALFLAFTLQPPLGHQSPAVEEAVKLADEVIALAKKDPTKVSYEVLAQAYAVKNQWTEAVRTYANGLRGNLDRAHADELMYLLDNHPKLKGPDAERVANPLMAEAHYGAGIRHYFNKRYDDAEKEFVAAVKNESQDARYHYFLGLSRLAQDKDEAYEDFAQGALLEARSRPARAAVSAALERVQGPVRTVLNEAREKAR